MDLQSYKKVGNYMSETKLHLGEDHEAQSN